MNEHQLPHQSTRNQLDPEGTEHYRAQEALRQSEEKYRRLFETMDTGFAVGEAMRDERGKMINYRLTQVNLAFEKLTGLQASQAVGKPILEVLPGLASWWLDTYQQVIDSGETVYVEEFLPQLGRWYEVTAFHYGREQLAAYYNDITERKQSQQHQAFLLNLSDTLRTQPNADAVANCALQRLAEHLQLDRCYIGVYRLDQDRGEFTHQVGNDRVPPVPDQVRLSDFPHALRVASAGTLVIDEVGQTAGLTEMDRQNLGALGFSALVASTLRHGEQNPPWSMVAISAQSRRWTPAEIKLIDEVTERTWDAIERAQADEALRESQRRFESIANLVPDLLWDSKPDGSTNWYNQRWLDYTGQRFEEAIGWGWLDAIHPDDREASAKRYNETVASGSSLQQEHRIRRHDGAYRWFVVSTAPLTDETGHVINVYGAATDITDHKLAQEAIQKSEQQLGELRHLTLLRQTEALARMGSWEYHRASEQFTWSAGMYQLTHVDPQRVLSPEIYLELVIEADRPQAHQLVDYLRAGQGHVEHQLRIQPGEASQTLRIKADVIGQGDQTRVVGVDIDLTQQLLAQQRIRETAESLQAVLDGSPASIGLLKAQRDETGRLVDFRLAVGNDRLARFLDEPLDHLLGQPAQRFRGLLWEEDTLTRLRHIFTTRQGHYEEKPLLPPHQDTWVALSVTQQDDGVVLTVLDITALKQTQAQQQHWLSELEASRHSVEALAQLKSALQHRSESLRAVSHDLKSNFGIITGSLSLLELAESEAEREQFVGMALRNVQQATGLLGELLDLTRLESSEQALRISAQDVSLLFRELGEHLAILAQQQGLALGVTGPDRLAVETDTLLLYRLLQNLTMNALKYTHQGRVDVTWGREPDGGQWWFSVADTGPGLAVHLVERLNAPDPLQAGAPAADSRHTIGSGEPAAKETWASLRGEGIGLRIVREITHLLGAQLQVSSEAGAGTRFVVHLPLNYRLS